MTQLTNGGKPHKCGEIAVHNTGRKDARYLCPKCDMPVDNPMTHHSALREEVKEKFEWWLHNNYPKELWGIVDYARIPDFIVDLLSQRDSLEQAAFEQGYEKGYEACFGTYHLKK